MRRLHLNEHTGGCSPQVLDAIARLRAEDMARYPDYDEVIAACARYFGIPAERLLLTNGLDEGILLACLVCLSPRHPQPEAIVLEPAFEMYAQFVELAGARTVAVAPRPDFAFSLEDVRGAISDATRLVFLTSPNNPTGLCIPRDAIREIARALPPGGYVFLDEAYTEFARRSFIDEQEDHPNVIVGRTFAKAYGLAGLRLGALVAHPAIITRLGHLAPPYRLNVCAVVGLAAALKDMTHVNRYLADVERSKEMLYEACERFGLEYWRSAANFVLVRAGARAPRLVRGLAERGIQVRDKSDAPGGAGCIRITAGLVDDTKACIAALEEVLCHDGP